MPLLNVLQAGLGPAQLAFSRKKEFREEVSAPISQKMVVNT